MKVLHLHIGLQKTGSSALQVFLASNADALRARDLDVPAIGEFALGARGRISSGNGALLARSLWRPERQGAIADGERHIAAFQEAVATSKAPALAISSELFLSGALDQERAVLMRLRDLASEAGATLRIVYILREQVAFLCAHYVQRVKRHGLAEAPEPFVARAAETLDFLRYDALHRMLTSVVGPGGARACIYENLRHCPGGLIGGVTALMGVDARELAPPPVAINPSLDPAQIALMRLLNRFAPRMALSDVLAADAAARGAVGYGSAEAMLPPVQRASLRARFAAGNAWVARHVFAREALFPPSPAEAPPYRPLDDEPLTSEQVARGLGALIVDLDQRLHALEAQVHAAHRGAAAGAETTG